MSVVVLFSICVWSGQGYDTPTQLYPWSEFELPNVNGYSILEALNGTHLSWQWIDSANNMVMDRMVITQTPYVAPVSSSASATPLLSVGAIAGIVCGGVVFVGVAVMVVLKVVFWSHITVIKVKTAEDLKPMTELVEL